MFSYKIHNCVYCSRDKFLLKNCDFRNHYKFLLTINFYFFAYLNFRFKLYLKPLIKLETKAKSRAKRMNFPFFALLSLFVVLLNTMSISGKAGHLNHSATKVSFMCHRLKICFKNKLEKPEKNKVGKIQQKPSFKNLASPYLKEILDSQPGILQIIGKPWLLIQITKKIFEVLSTLFFILRMKKLNDIGLDFVKKNKLTSIDKQ